MKHTRGGIQVFPQCTSIDSLFCVLRLSSATSTVQTDRPIWQYSAYSGNMNLSNYVKFDNLTLNFSVGAKLSIAGYFPFAHLFITKF